MITLQTMGMCQCCGKFVALVNTTREEGSAKEVDTVITCKYNDICSNAYNRGVKDALEERSIDSD